ncbi:MAG: glycosyltransferase [Flavobacteriaceae bacterium]|nr:glycosyltransferase [Flavobacteriaceae bacterium]
MKQPFLSIITINYNDALGLERTISSVLEQRYTDFEFIVIDGDSKDGSVDVIKKYEEKFAYWVSEPDSGIYNAMNKGIAASKGEFLLFLNGGDLLTSNTALQNFISHPSFQGDIIYGDYKFEKGKKVYPDTLYPAYFMKTSLPHQSTFFRKNVFEQLGNYDESYRMGGDRDFFIRAYLSGQFEFVHVPCFSAFFNLDGISNNEAHQKQKKEEDERMFKANYGVLYDDCKKQLALEQELKRAKRNTVNGILKRVAHKIKMIWTSRS